MGTQTVIVSDIVEQLGLNVVTGTDLGREITGGYASDLLSCVMAGAKEGNVWVTLQAHPNVVAVASLVGLSAVVITEGIQPSGEATSRAQDEGIVLLTTPETTFTVVGRLAAMGI